MLPYVILILLPMVVAAVRTNGIVRIGNGVAQNKRNTEITVFFGIFLALLVLRDEACGSDTQNYFKMFEQAGQRSWSSAISNSTVELGYTVFSKFIYLISGNTRFFLVVTTAIIVIPLYWFYKKESELPVLTIVLFIVIAPFSMYFSGIRQAMAMACVFPAWEFARKKKWIKFLLLVLVATTFHRSAFVILALYPMCHMRVTVKWLYVVAPVMILIYIFNKPIFSVLMLLWGEESTVESIGESTILLLALFAVYAFVVADEDKLEKEVLGYRNILLLAVAIQSFASVHGLAMRMNYYFLPFIPVLIPKIANRSKEGTKNLANVSVIVMTVVFALYFFLRAYRSENIMRIYPYTFFWQ